MEPTAPGLTSSDESLDPDDSFDSTHTSDPRRSSTADIPAGTRIGRYIVISRIGAGAMGEAWLAEHDDSAPPSEPDIDR